LILHDGDLWITEAWNQERVMKKHSPSRRGELAIYRIKILGTLDKQWSAYCGGMTIEHRNDPHHGAMTILVGRLADQSAFIGILNALHDLDCPILSAEWIEAM
jgi:hypothetical protein